MRFKDKHRNSIVILSLLLVVSICANMLLYYKFNIEKNKIKSPIAYDISSDYFTNMVQKVKADTIPEYCEYPNYYGLYYDDVIDTPIIAQNPNFPNGCEAASTVMLLNYYNIDISLEEFVSKYLRKKSVKDINGVRIGPNPAQYYAGDPSDEKRGWGCFAPAIIDSIKKLAEDNGYVVFDVSLYYLDDLSFSNYLPCVVWTTTDYTEALNVYTWKSVSGKNTYTYPQNSHTVLLVGIDENYVYINDPLKPDSVQKVDKEQFRLSYDSMGRQAISLSNTALDSVVDSPSKISER